MHINTWVNLIATKKLLIRSKKLIQEEQILDKIPEIHANIKQALRNIEYLLKADTDGDDRRRA